MRSRSIQNVVHDSGGQTAFSTAILLSGDLAMQLKTNRRFAKMWNELDVNVHFSFKRVRNYFFQSL